MAFQPAETIASDSTDAIAGADDYLFGVLQSSMFTQWLHAVGGRIKSDPRFSVEVVYNNFPFPTATDAQAIAIVAGAKAVLAARDAEPGATLGDLYDPDSMPADLLHAHRQLDRAVEAAFVGSRRRLRTNAERLTVLFDNYVRLAQLEELPLKN